jgi:hypothetical protein
VRDAIWRWNAVSGWLLGATIEPVGWETHAVPEFEQQDRHPQKVLNEQIVDSCDFGIAMFWTKPGSPTDTHASGSLEEIARLRDAGKTVHALFSTRDVPAKLVDTKNLEAIKGIRESFKIAGLYGEFSSDAELKEHVLNILATHAVRRSRTVFATRADAAPTIKVLLVREPQAVTIVGSTLGGTLRALPDMAKLLNAKAADFRIDLMIAAPKYLVARARQENLPVGAELDAAYQRVYELLQATDVPVDRIRLYTAPPT